MLLRNYSLPARITQAATFQTFAEKFIFYYPRRKEKKSTDCLPSKSIRSISIAARRGRIYRANLGALEFPADFETWAIRSRRARHLRDAIKSEKKFPAITMTLVEIIAINSHYSFPPLRSALQLSIILLSRVVNSRYIYFPPAHSADSSVINF